MKTDDDFKTSYAAARGPDDVIQAIALAAKHRIEKPIPLEFRDYLDPFLISLMEAQNTAKGDHNLVHLDTRIREIEAQASKWWSHAAREGIAHKKSAAEHLSANRDMLRYYGLSAGAYADLLQQEPYRSMVEKGGLTDATDFDGVGTVVRVISRSELDALCSPKSVPSKKHIEELRARHESSRVSGTGRGIATRGADGSFQFPVN